MKAFREGDRVLVVLVDAVDCAGPAMVVLPEPVPGVVWRRRFQDNGAWVRLEARLGILGAHPFPSDDARANCVLTYPEFCRKLPRAR